MIIFYHWIVEKCAYKFDWFFIFVFLESNEFIYKICCSCSCIHCIRLASKLIIPILINWRFQSNKITLSVVIPNDATKIETIISFLINANRNYWFLLFLVFFSCSFQFVILLLNTFIFLNQFSAIHFAITYVSASK